MKITQYATKKGVTLNPELFSQTIPNLPDIHQIYYIHVSSKMNAANRRSQGHFRRLCIESLALKLTPSLKSLISVPREQHNLVLYDGRQFCLVVDLTETDLKLMERVRFQFPTFVRSLAEQMYVAYGLCANPLEVVLRLGWVPHNQLHQHLQKFQVSDRADRLKMMSQAWEIKAPEVDIRTLETQASLADLLTSTRSKKTALWAFFPAAMQHYFSTVSALIDPSKINFDAGFVVAYFPACSDWDKKNSDKQLKNYVRVLRAQETYAAFLKSSYASTWICKYLPYPAPGTENATPKLSQVMAKCELQQWIVLRDYLYRVSIHRDDLFSKKEWFGMLAALFNAARTVTRAGLLSASIFSISLENALWATLLLWPTYFFERAFMKINTPVYANVSFLGRRFESVELFLLQHRAGIFKSSVLIQPFVTTFATMNMVQLLDLSNLGMAGTFAVVLAVQLLRSAAVWMRFAETVGLEPITKNGFFEHILWFLQNLGGVRLAYALWPLVEAAIYSGALYKVTTAHLGLNQATGIAAFCFGLIAQSAFTRAYDVNYFLRPLWQNVVDKLKVDNHFSRFTNRWVENAFENPVLEPLLSLRIVPQLFAYHSLWSAYLYLLFTPIFKISAGLARGYLIDLTLIEHSQALGYHWPIIYAMTTISFLSQCAQIRSKFREVRYEILEGPTEHAHKEVIPFAQRFKLPEERPYLKGSFLLFSAAFSVIFDLFLKSRCFSETMVDMIDSSLVTHSSFVYMMFIFLYTVFETALACECRKPVVREKSSRVQPVIPTRSSGDSRDYGFDDISTTPEKLPMSPTRHRTPGKKLGPSPGKRAVGW